MSDDKQERPNSNSEPHPLLERQLDERWETVSPGIYRLREDRPPDTRPVQPLESTVQPAASIEWVLQELVAAAEEEAPEPKKKRRGSKKPKSKHAS